MPNRSPEACVDMPFTQCRDGIWEIDEFDCASCFLVEGTERALLLDTGVGIGDLRWLVENRITEKPYEVIVTHNHEDHLGGAAWFDRIRMHPADIGSRESEIEPPLSGRRGYAELIRKRTGKTYPYDPEKDIRPWPKIPVIKPLSDGQVFDLGGRTVTVHHCPGHTAGEIVLTDSKTKTLLCSDACNCNWLLNRTLAPTLRECVQKSLSALEKIMTLAGSAFTLDSVFNFHHDFRPFGQPLAPDVLPDLIACLESLLDGTARFELEPDPLSPGKSRKIARFGSVMVSCMGGDIEKEL